MTTDTIDGVEGLLQLLSGVSVNHQNVVHAAPAHVLVLDAKLVALNRL